MHNLLGKLALMVSLTAAIPALAHPVFTSERDAVEVVPVQPSYQAVGDYGHRDWREGRDWRQGRDWRDERRGRENREHEWREHAGWNYRNQDGRYYR
jgi:hypothetical protein